MVALVWIPGSLVHNLGPDYTSSGSAYRNREMESECEKIVSTENVRNFLTFSRPGKIRARRQTGKRPRGGSGFQKAAVLGGDIAAACFASISATVPQRDASAF